MFMSKKVQPETKTARKTNFPAIHKAAIKKALEEYADKTTIHGIRYFKDSKFVFERLWWILVIVTSITVCTIFIVNVYNKWNRSPVIVSFASKPTPVITVPLPAITICPQASITDRIATTYKKFDRLTEKERQRFFNNSFVDYEIFHEALNILCPKLLQSNLPLKRQFYPYYFYEALKFLAPLKADTILACGEENKLKTNCLPKFQKVVSRKGICYTFNAISPYHLYRDDVLHSVSDLKTMSEIEEREVTWTLEKGYMDRSRFLDNYPMNDVGGMFGKPYSFIFSVLSDKLTYNCESFQGFKAFLHPPNDMPIYTPHYIKIPIETDVRISVTPKVTSTSEEVVNYSPQLRNCFFNSERYLRFFKEYTEVNCYMECLANYSMRQCDCVPFELPRLLSTKICGLAREDCFLEVQLNVTKKSFLKIKEAGRDECDCKPACVTISYDVDTYYSPADSLAEIYEKLNMTKSNSRSLKTSAVTISYLEAEFLQTRRRELFSRTDVVANVGGILGLFLGFSVVSFAEFIYFSIIYPYIVHRQHKKKKNNNDTFEKVTELKMDNPRYVKFLHNVDKSNIGHFNDYIT